MSEPSGLHKVKGAMAPRPLYQNRWHDLLFGMDCSVHQLESCRRGNIFLSRTFMAHSAARSVLLVERLMQ